jgi:hypothetical protein
VEFYSFQFQITQAMFQRFRRSLRAKIRINPAETDYTRGMLGHFLAMVWFASE